MMLIAGFDLIYGIVCILGMSYWEPISPIIIISELIFIYAYFLAQNSIRDSQVDR
jgi:hypothetical protein